MAGNKAYIEASGCKRRKLELSKVRMFLISNGYEIVNSPLAADHIVFSSCSFKKEEEDYSLLRITDLEKFDAKVLVMGCLPAIAPKKFKEVSTAQHITPENINDIDKLFDSKGVKYSEIGDYDNLDEGMERMSTTTSILKFIEKFGFSREFLNKSASHAAKRVKAMLGYKPDYHLLVNRGCLGNCSYCAIRFAIGSVKSTPIDMVLGMYKKGVGLGYKNFVIQGDDVGAYGIDMESSFPVLMTALIQEASKNGGTSFLLEEINPRWILLYKEEMLDILCSGAIKAVMCPIQSGNERVLGLMKRFHSVSEAKSLLKEIKKSAPGLSLNTQIIVGFPSETESEFQDTLDFLKEVRFDSVIIFPYHEKENVSAKEIQPKVSDEVAAKRMDKAKKYLKKHKIKAYLSCQ